MTTFRAWVVRLDCIHFCVLPVWTERIDSLEPAGTLHWQAAVLGWWGAVMTLLHQREKKPLWFNNTQGLGWQRQALKVEVQSQSLESLNLVWHFCVWNLPNPYFCLLYQYVPLLSMVLLLDSPQIPASECGEIQSFFSVQGEVHSSIYCAVPQYHT